MKAIGESSLNEIPKSLVFMVDEAMVLHISGAIYFALVYPVTNSVCIIKW